MNRPRHLAAEGVFKKRPRAAPGDGIRAGTAIRGALLRLGQGGTGAVWFAVALETPRALASRKRQLDRCAQCGCAVGYAFAVALCELRRHVVRIEEKIHACFLRR
ncbi:hypothetical protein MRX96_043257 [Rhipicephalus microplus]